MDKIKIIVDDLSRLEEKWRKYAPALLDTDDDVDTRVAFRRDEEGMFEASLMFMADTGDFVEHYTHNSASGCETTLAICFDGLEEWIDGEVKALRGLTL